MKKYIIALALFVAAASCTSLKEEFQPVFSGPKNPDPAQPVSMTATHTIAQLASRYKVGSPWKIDENIIISGIVSTTDQPGNFYKSFSTMITFRVSEYMWTAVTSVWECTDTSPVRLMATV